MTKDEKNLANFFRIFIASAILPLHCNISSSSIFLTLAWINAAYSLVTPVTISTGATKI
jgi:hypothetical protein